MKRFITLLAATSFLAMAVPAFALFTNGGFEDGTFTGWTLNGTGAGLSAVIDVGSVQPYQTLPINPYNGNKMARLQDYYGGYHSTTISQTDNISAADLASGGKLYVNWGAVLDEPNYLNPPHSVSQQPAFDISVYRNGGVVGTFHADAQTKQGGGWVLAGTEPYGDFWYKSGTFVFDFGSFVLNDSIKVEMTVKDCALGGHGGYAFLDGIGTTYQPPSTVPEPSALFLLGAGMAGFAIWRRKQRA